MSVARAANAGAWSAIDIVLRQGVQFGVSIVLARLLAPEDFGLIALLAFFSGLSIVFVQGGLSLALVQRQDTTPEQETGVFWANLLAGTLFALILIAIAPTVARFYEYPLLDPLMYVAAAQVVLSALGAVQTSLLTRTLRFDLLAKTGIYSSLISAAAAVGAALAGWGVWALALQLVVQAVVGVVALWWVSDWRPSWVFRPRAIGDLFNFGFFMSLSSILEVLYTQGFALIVGKVFGVADLGMFNRAQGVPSMAATIITTIVGRTALPFFAARVGDAAALRRAFKGFASVAMLLTLPAMAGLAVLSELVLVTLFGAKWLPAVPVMTVLAVGGIMLPLHVLNLNLLLAQGGSKHFLGLEIRKKLLGIVIIGAGGFYGLLGIAYASLVFGVIALVINAASTARTIDYPLSRQFWDVRGIALATALMAVGVAALQPFVPGSEPVRLIILAASGAVLYALIGFGLRLGSFTEALATVRVLLKSRGRNAAEVEI